MEESNWLFYGSATLAGIFFAAVIFVILAILLPAPHLTISARVVLGLLISIPLVPMVFAIILAIRKWWKKRPIDQQWRRDYQMGLLIKSIDDALERYERLCPESSEKLPFYEYAYLPPRVPTPRGAAAPRF